MYTLWIPIGSALGPIKYLKVAKNSKNCHKTEHSLATKLVKMGKNATNRANIVHFSMYEAKRNYSWIAHQLDIETTS